MNSIIQCLNHVNCLAKYFLENDYKGFLNPESDSFIIVNQWNKVMYIPLVAVLVQCSTFSFTIIPPTQILQNATDINAEAYPGKGLVANLIIIFLYAITDYILMIMIKSDHKLIAIQQSRLQINNIDGGASSVARSDIDTRSEFVIKYQIKQRYLSSSYL